MSKEDDGIEPVSSVYGQPVTQRRRSSAVADKYIGRDGSAPNKSKPRQRPKLNGRDNAALDEMALAQDQKRESGDGILQDVETYLARFVSYPSEHARVAHVLWIAHTHLMDCWESTPRINFSSAERGSGKTRALEVTEGFVRNPIHAVNVTPTYLFRKVGEASEEGSELPVILYDEVDTVFSGKAENTGDIRGLLNAGHRRGAVAGRCVTSGKKVTTEEIPAYCAVALAGIGNLPDTIASRSILIEMRRRAPDEPVEPFRRRLHFPQAF